MADESKPAENLVKLEENTESPSDTIDSNNTKNNSELVETSPEVSTSSNTSRYGRARKPKITEDYYNIEDIFGPYERITSSSPRRKSQKIEQSPKKIDSIDLKLVNSKPIDIKPVDISSILSINIPEVNVNMSKVMKIVSNNDFSPKSPNYPPKPLKTYGNKKKILESHEYKFTNGAKFEISDSDHIKSARLFSDESLSTDSSESPKRTKKYVKNSVSASEDQSFDTSIFKKNKKLKKLQRELNIDGFKEGRLRSSVAESSEQEEDDKDVVFVEAPKVKRETIVIEDNEENIEHLEGLSSYAPKIGDLSWSRVGSYPFWPSIVTREPVTDRHSKIIMFGRRNVLCYHVHFFGDNGRRSWVYGSHIFPFNRRSDLEVMAQSVSKDSKPKDPKHLSAFIINPNKLKKWETAVTEAESLTEIARDVRIEKFFEMVGPKTKKLDVKIKIKTKKKPVIKEEIVISDDSFSETDIPVTIKQEIRDTPSPQPISTLQRLKRINLFRGITKDRACQICGKNKNVFKCKGNCFGLYHIECDKKIRRKLITRLSDDQYSDSDSDGEIAKKKPEEIVGSILSEILDKTFDESDKKLQENISTTISLSMAAQIDLKMQEIMQNLIADTKYTDSTTDEEPEESDGKKFEEYAHLPYFEDESSDSKPKGVKKTFIKHVTADGLFDVIEEEEANSEETFRCAFCSKGVKPPCFICNAEVAKSGDRKRHRCFTHQCGKYYHSECLKDWPQTKWNVSSKSKKIENETLCCPYHNCHTCISDNPRGPLSRYTNEKLAKCIRCPTTYHSSTFCIPAGTEILSTYQLICPKHLTEEDDDPPSPSSKKPTKIAKTKIMPHVNASWCFICSMGGSLICCETCPSAFHVECLKLVPPEGRYFCEECESGRLPLYDEIVWVKLGAYRWWPAQILFPADVPPNVACIPHTVGEFVVRFFGSHDHYWVNRGRVFLFQEGDTGHASSKKSAVDGLFVKAIEEATKAHKRFVDDRENRLAEARNGMRPPPFVKIKVNRPVGNVRTNDADTSNTTPCDCDPNWEQPCGPDSDCLNRILMTECNPMVCAAGSRCCNQSFEKRLYAPVLPFKTSGRGWGLKTLAPVKKGSFVIEYVGELINETEYHRRMKRKHEQKDENYYFLTIDKDRMIDAGPKGNVARFMNHSCSPNCETQKWTVNGDTRVGLFAITDIEEGAELTFNYNLECIGEEKKECRCGAQNCSGFIGVKAKQDEPAKKRKSLPVKPKKKKPPTETKAEVISCFVCGEPDAIQPCDREACNKFYHWNCVGLEGFQEAKWYCPWHSCNVCTKRTTRCCYMCINSFCPIHSEGNIRYDRVKGFVCTAHDIKEEEEPKEDAEESSKTKDKDTNKLKKNKKQTRNSIDILDNRSSTEEILENIEKDTSEEMEDKNKSLPELSDSSKEEIKEINSDISLEKDKKPRIALKTDKKHEVKNGLKIEEPNSIKKRKSRLSLKKNPESLTISSNSSQDELSDDEKPLVALKKLKLVENSIETEPKEPKKLRSSTLNISKTENPIAPSLKKSKKDPNPTNKRKSLRSHKLEDSDDNITYEETPPEVKRPRGRPRKYPKPPPNITIIATIPKKKKGRPRKHKPAEENLEQVTEMYKLKLTDQIPKNPYDNHVNEVKLTANVPERHLRVVLRKSEIESETKVENKFIKMQNDIEKDLPIRKRSKLRYETQL